MILSVGKAKQHQVLASIIDDNSIFRADSEVKIDWEHMVLTLFLFYEMTLGVKSYWFPYLRLMPDTDFTSSWSDSDITHFEDKIIL